MQAMFRQSEIKKMTVLTHKELLSCYEIITWLRKYGEVINMLVQIRDEFANWSGAWTFSQSN